MQAGKAPQRSEDRAGQNSGRGAGSAPVGTGARRLCYGDPERIGRRGRVRILGVRTNAVNLSPDSPPPVPYGFASERLVVRCYEPADAERLQRLLARNREHLLPWLPWAAGEPQSLEEKLETIRRFRGEFDRGGDFVMGIFLRETGTLIGGTGLHPRIGPDAFEIGYWIDREFEGQGLVQESTRGLVRLAFQHHRRAKVEIRLDPRNERSRAVPRALGMHLDGVLRSQLAGSTPDAPRIDAEVWSLLAEDFLAREGDFPPLEVWDAATRPLPGGPE